jgi:hypothetical protein
LRRRCGRDWKEVKDTEGIKERKGGQKELREDAEMKEKGKEGRREMYKGIKECIKGVSD